MKYTQAPLPFQGQKRRWRKDFAESIKNFDDCTIFVDLFGGSGLLSHYVKNLRPDATVIYNDYDNYCARINNVTRTNVLIKSIYNVISDYPDGKVIRSPYRDKILQLIEAEELKTGYVDYITLSASILFSMKYVTSYTMLQKETLYNNIKQHPYRTEGYLDGLNIVRQDYRELWQKWRYHPNVCFLVDPPYLSTDTTTYNNYWKLGAYLDVLQVLKDTNYYYFTSNKSSILELCDWCATNLDAENPFAGATETRIKCTLNHSASYHDIMLFKHR